MIEEITAPITPELPPPPKDKTKRRSLLVAIGLPLLTIFILWLTTDKPEPPPPEVAYTEPEREPEEPELDLSQLTPIVRTYAVGELKKVEDTLLKKFHANPFSNHGKEAGKIAKYIHQIRALAPDFRRAFLEANYESGFKKYWRMRTLDQKIREIYKLPFLGPWAKQLSRWKGEISKLAEQVYFEGYALMRTSPREAAKRYELVLKLAGEHSPIGERARQALGGLGISGI